MVNHSILLCFFLSFTIHIWHVNADDCNPDYAPEKDGTKIVTIFEKATNVFEQLAENQKLQNSIKKVSEKVLGACSSLPLIGAGFAFVGAAVDIFGPKPPSDEMQCMKQEFAHIRKELDKINTKLDVITGKLEVMDKKLDYIIKLLHDYNILDAYNQYFKEPILRLHRAYKTYSKSKYHPNRRDDFIASCRQDQPLNALDWVNRTVYGTDKNTVKLLEHIYENATCDGAEQLGWAETIFFHTGLAATMDQMCFAAHEGKRIAEGNKEETFLNKILKQSKKRSEIRLDQQVKDTKAQFVEVAQEAEDFIKDIKKAFEERERPRQDRCFKELLTMWNDKSTFAKFPHVNCTCDQLQKKPYWNVDCPSLTVSAKLGTTFDLLDVLVCVLPSKNPKGKKVLFEQFGEEAVLVNAMGDAQCGHYDFYISKDKRRTWEINTHKKLPISIYKEKAGPEFSYSANVELASCWPKSGSYSVQ